LLPLVLSEDTELSRSPLFSYSFPVTFGAAPAAGLISALLSTRTSTLSASLAFAFYSSAAAAARCFYNSSFFLRLNSSASLSSFYFFCLSCY
jgi:hypothetical protein